MLKALDTAFIQKSDAAPPLQQVDAEDRYEALKQASSATEVRRRLLLAFVRDDGWAGSDVTQPDAEAEM